MQFKNQVKSKEKSREKLHLASHMAHCYAKGCRRNSPFQLSLLGHCYDGWERNVGQRSTVIHKHKHTSQRQRQRHESQVNRRKTLASLLWVVVVRLKSVSL